MDVGVVDKLLIYRHQIYELKSDVVVSKKIQTLTRAVKISDGIWHKLLREVKDTYNEDKETFRIFLNGFTDPELKHITVQDLCIDSEKLKKIYVEYFLSLALPRLEKWLDDPKNYFKYKTNQT